VSGQFGGRREPFFEFFELVEKDVFDFECFLFVGDKLYGFVERPRVLLYEVGQHNTGSSGVAIDGMHEHTLSFIHRLFDEGADHVYAFVFFIEDLNISHRTFDSRSDQCTDRYSTPSFSYMLGMLCTTVLMMCVTLLQMMKSKSSNYGFSYLCRELIAHVKAVLDFGGV
jgi:hypothetical protein